MDETGAVIKRNRRHLKVDTMVVPVVTEEESIEVEFEKSDSGDSKNSSVNNISAGVDKNEQERSMAYRTRSGREVR